MVILCVSSLTFMSMSCLRRTFIALIPKTIGHLGIRAIGSEGFQTYLPGGECIILADVLAFRMKQVLGIDSNSLSSVSRQ